MLNSIMSFQLNSVVPWGRSYAEYIQMFSLSESDLSKHILGCSDGPASFNSEHTVNGGIIVSIDPIYQLSSDLIRTRVRETSEQVYAQLKENRASFKWSHFGTPENLLNIRLSAMEIFLSDFTAGKEQGRYIAEELPSLSFKENEFNLSLCSHFLFLYSEQLSFEFHLFSILELLRVSSEIRIFPIIELNNQRSRHLDGLLEKLFDLGFICKIEQVDYEFQIGGNQVLRISRRS
ncbi:hypothetical protein P4C99_06985 [Pontiellaceae bacterium B1224]|nr:hypothetical protein [Pontiellaceae bacterium B1224]